MYSAIEKNKRNTVLIMVLFVILVGLIGLAVSYYFAGDFSMTAIIVVMAAVYALLQYFLANNLAVAMTGARQIDKSEFPELWRVVENISITSGLPMPKVYVIDDPSPNAFATGRNPKHTIVGVTTGLLEIMEKRELEAVMSHEMSHVQNYDIRVSMITFGLVSAIGVLADIALRMMFYGGGNRDKNSNPIVWVVGLAVIILAPIFATIIQLAISRQREYLADASGVMMTRDTEGLVSALEKLKSYGKPMKQQGTSTANLFLSNPLRPSFFSRIFSSHPPLDDRIARLKNSSTKM